MFSTKELKLQAKNNLEGKYFKYFLVMLTTTLLSSVPAFFDPEGTSLFISLISIAISAVVAVFLYRTDMNIALGKEEFIPKISDISNIIVKSILLMFLIVLIATIGLIILIIPGLIALLLFSQAFYILVDDPSKSVTECLKESKLMMKGNMMNYIILQISFIPKMILGVLTLGIGFFWIIPEVQVATANFYFYVKKNHK